MRLPEGVHPAPDLTDVTPLCDGSLSRSEPRRQALRKEQDTTAMRLHLLRRPSTQNQVQEMLEAQGSDIKLAVDVAQGLVVGGGEYHADCEELLLAQGSRQEDIWGAEWYPDRRTVTFGALITIRPRQDNRSMEVQDAALRARIEQIVRAVFEGTTP
jgi:hypothetical protein